jgi:hypothetical protein
MKIRLTEACSSRGYVVSVKLPKMTPLMWLALVVIVLAVIGLIAFVGAIISWVGFLLKVGFFILLIGGALWGVMRSRSGNGN